MESTPLQPCHAAEPPATHTSHPTPPLTRRQTMRPLLAVGAVAADITAADPMTSPKLPMSRLLPMRPRRA